MERQEITSIRQISDFAKKLPESWILSGIQIDGNCYQNSTVFYYEAKKRFTNEVQVKIGSTIHQEPLPQRPLSHAWNIMVINGSPETIDITHTYCMTVHTPVPLSPPNYFAGLSGYCRITHAGNMALWDDDEDFKFVECSEVIVGVVRMIKFLEKCT